MKFRPLHDRVVVRRIEGEEKTKGGIIIPDTAKEKPQEGEVIAVGPGARDESGKLVAARRQGRRPRALRQVVGHRGQDRRRGPPHHEGVRHHGRRRADGRQEEGRLIAPARATFTTNQEASSWLPKTSDSQPMLATACCAASIFSPTP